MHNISHLIYFYIVIQFLQIIVRVNKIIKT